MSIKVSTKKSVVHFREPFKISFEEVKSAEIAVVKLEDAKGNLGLGSASLDTGVTKETVDETLNIIRKKATPDFFKYPIFEWQKYHELIQNEFMGMPLAQCALESAVLNLFSSQVNKSLDKIFGGFRKKCPIMITIGIKDTEKTTKEVLKRLKQGFKVIKLKIGIDLNEDVARIKAVSQIIPDGIAITLDANHGYTYSEAEKLLKKINHLKITLLEQPVEKIQEIKELGQLSKIPLIADESAVSVQDAFDILKNNLAAGVNIKLMKCGGPVNFLKIFNLAKSFGKMIMIGCTYESNISITMGANLALGLPLDYADLDSGHLDFDDDPADGGAEVKDGYISLAKPLSLKD